MFILLPYLNDIIVALANDALSLDMTPGKVANSMSLNVTIYAVFGVACLAETAGSDFLPFLWGYYVRSFRLYELWFRDRSG